jgi:hypothetical protein
VKLIFTAFTRSAINVYPEKDESSFCPRRKVR